MYSCSNLSLFVYMSIMLTNDAIYTFAEYMAPEMLSRQGYGRAADYWSLGCITYEMLNGLPPFSSKQGAKALFRKIMSEKVKMPPGSTAAACKLLKGLLCRNVQQRLGTTRNTMFEIGGVAALKNMEFFAEIDWKKLELLEMEPPHVFNVADDHDLKHFHEEFTGMPLPRSVVLMSGDDYKARRIESANFRGFSFVQEDFDIPERDQVELESYWDSADGDGESLSDCASSKLDFTDDKPEEAEKKKRPPRKRKKKKKAGVSVDNTPVPSNAGTPAQSRDNTPAVTPTPTENGEATPEDVTKAEAKEDPKPQETKRSSPPLPQPALLPNVPTPVPARAPKPRAEVWQAASAKKKNATRGGYDQKNVRGVRAPQGRTVPGQQPHQPGQQYRGGQNRHAQTTSGFRTQAQPDAVATKPTPWSRAGQQQAVNTRTHTTAASRQTPWARSSAQQGGGGAWGSTAASRPQPVATPPRQPPPPAPAPSPSSSDWRQHEMSPHSSKRTLDQTAPSWPSLANAPPLNAKAAIAKPASNAPLRGAWASRTKS